MVRLRITVEADVEKVVDALVEQELKEDVPLDTIEADHDELRGVLEEVVPHERDGGTYGDDVGSVTAYRVLDCLQFQEVEFGHSLEFVEEDGSSVSDDFRVDDELE